jgi:hypothetical protein
MGIDHQPDTYTHGFIMAERQKEYDKYLLEKQEALEAKIEERRKVVEKE